MSEIVRAGYDQMAERFAAWRRGCTGSPEVEWVEDLLSRLPHRADVLELGCGQAEKPTQLLAERCRLLGVDISSEQLRRARKRCPAADFQQADITMVRFEPASFDAVVAIYVLNHVSRADLPALLERIAAWLRPRGHLLATFGQSGAEGIEDNWLGVPMFFASYTEPENRQLVEHTGLEIERDEVVTIHEPEPAAGEARFQWILARRDASKGA